METSSLQTDDGLRLQYLETGHWRGDFLAAWMTGSGRQREYEAAPGSRLLIRLPRWPRSACGGLKENPVPATSGHPNDQKNATPMTGFKVQPTYADGRSKVRILQSSRT